MTRFQLVCIPVALVAMASSARAQHVGGSGTSASGSHVTQARQASGGSWTGKASKWGGSPISSPSTVRANTVYVVRTYAYIPTAIVAPTPVPVVAYADTVVVGAENGPVTLQVVPRHAPRELTTMDVYRQQRFVNP
jgi:hypothetical protein